MSEHLRLLSNKPAKLVCQIRKITPLDVGLHRGGGECIPLLGRHRETPTLTGTKYVKPYPYWHKIWAQIHTLTGTNPQKMQLDVGVSLPANIMALRPGLPHLTFDLDPRDL